MEKLVRDAYAARKRGDYDAMVELCAPSATLRLAGAPEHFAIAGTTRDRAAVHWRAKVTFKPTGKSAVTEFCDLWTIRNGKMTSLIQFIDTALVGHMVA